MCIFEFVVVSDSRSDCSPVQVGPPRLVARHRVLHKTTVHEDQHANLLYCACSKDARSKDQIAADKLKAAKGADSEAAKYEDEAAKLGDRASRAQQRAEATEKEAHSIRTGLTGLSGDAKGKRQAAEK